jgi:hypothetical protein
MIQAIGRARRFGQLHTVHIHRLMALKTYDVNIVQDRENKALVRRGNEYLLVEPKSLMEGDVDGWRGQALPTSGEEEWEEGEEWEEE